MADIEQMDVELDKLYDMFDQLKTLTEALADLIVNAKELSEATRTDAMEISSQLMEIQ